MSHISKQQTIASLVVLLASVARVARPPVEVKGVPLGASGADVMAAFPNATCNTGPNDTAWRASVVSTARATSSDALRCSAGDTGGCEAMIEAPLRFGAALPCYYVLKLHEGRLGFVLIGMASDAIAQTVMTLSEKYGSPTSDMPSVAQNLMGTAFDDRMVTWKLPDGKIQAQQRSSTINNGTVLIVAPWHVDDVRAEDKHAAEAAAGCL